MTEKIGVFLLIALAVAGGLIGYSLAGRAVPSLGSAGTDPSYGVGANATTTNTTATCPAATSTQIVGIQTGRLSFEVSHTSTNTITLCKNSFCVAGASGILLVASTTWAQNDSYVGAYSCISSHGSSTLGVSYTGK